MQCTYTWEIDVFDHFYKKGTVPDNLHNTAATVNSWKCTPIKFQRLWF